MKPNLPPFSRAYRSALRRHLNPDAAASAAAAQKLGRRAASLKLETLELAHLHDECVHSLILAGAPPRATDSLMRRARAFFAEVLTPVEETHRSVREVNAQMKLTVASLTRRTSQLAAANERLQKEVARRRGVEESLRASENTSKRLLEKSGLMQEELRLLSHRLLSAQEEERKTISRELHDVIGQTLAGINLRLAALKAQSAASARELQRIIGSTQRLVEKSVAIVHRFARELRPAVLDDLGLIPAIESYLAGFTSDTGLKVAFAAFAGVEKQDGSVRTVMYRVMQEALANVAQHAKATQATVSITNRRGAMLMEIADNGIGFDIHRAHVATASTRLGLLGMRERVEMAGGTFTVVSAPGSATTIRAAFPLRPKKPVTRPQPAP